MRSTNWKDIAELIGISAIVASLIFVGLQMRQAEEIAITETRSSVTQTISELSAMIGNNTNIWKRGLDGDDLTEEERILFYSMVEAVESHFFNLFLRFRRLNINAPESHARNYAFALYEYQGLRRCYTDEANYLQVRAAAFGGSTDGNAFRVLVSAYLEELDEKSPPVPMEKRYVFW